MSACVSKHESTEHTKTEIPTDEEPYTLTPIYESPVFKSARLTMYEPIIEESGNVHFSYGVENYVLTDQTSDAEIKNCANSLKGQHIHLILNNEPYFAHYESEFDRMLKPGHYVSLSFLSRSYHESLKSHEAFVLSQFTVGDVISDTVDLNAPHMFYSRPKGEYSGVDTKKILLDFYLVNTVLSESGNKVRATINDQEFLIDRWTPHFVEGLPTGENTIRLELIDSVGNLISGSFNSVERKVTLIKN